MTAVLFGKSNQFLSPQRIYSSWRNVSCSLRAQRLSVCRWWYPKTGLRSPKWKARSSGLSSFSFSPPYADGNPNSSFWLAWAWKDPLEECMANHSSILPGKSHGQRSRAGYNLEGHKESDTTETTLQVRARAHTHTHTEVIHFSPFPCLCSQSPSSLCS